MMRRVKALLLSALFVPSVVFAQSAPMTAEEATQEARASSEGVAGEFTMVVCRTGHVEGSVFLDSRENYRDPRSLNIEIPDEVVQRAGLTVDGLQSAYLGRRIRVTGLARRVLIGVYDQHGNVAGTYYQVHVHISTLAAVQLDGLQRDAAACRDEKTPMVS